MGYTLDLPVIAPMIAPPEDKKLILSQTKERIQEAGMGDWQSKTHLLTQRFVAAVPNASNEAKVRLTKFRDWSSNVFSFGPPIGLQTDMNFCDLNHTLMLRYLSVELRIHPKRAPPEDNPVPDLPGERCIQAILKLPLSDDQTDVHPSCTLQTLMNVGTLITLMKMQGMEITFGCLSPIRTFDIPIFDKQFREIQGECLFHAVAAVLLRDYVGKGITKDIQKRLRDCRQVQFIAGKRRVKPVEEQHADFMRLVQEFDVDEFIPANLPNIAFHNASWDIQQELIHMKYEPPTECTTNAEQYRGLAEFHEKAKEAESRLTQMESMMKRMRGTNQQTTTSFLTRVAPEDEQYLLEQADVEGIQYGPDPHNDVQELATQNSHLVAMLSVAEKAIRKASGEIAPLECWGCKDFPEFQEDKFHRYRSCPRRNEPRVRANFEKNLRTWTSRKRPNHYERPGNRGQERPEKARRIGEPEKKAFMGLVTGEELGLASIPEQREIGGDLSQISDEANLMSVFGISQEGEVTKQTSLRANMACPRCKTSPSSAFRDVRCPTPTRRNNPDDNPGNLVLHNDWAQSWRQELPRNRERGTTSGARPTLVTRFKSEFQNLWESTPTIQESLPAGILLWTRINTAGANKLLNAHKPGINSLGRLQDKDQQKVGITPNKKKTEKELKERSNMKQAIPPRRKPARNNKPESGNQSRNKNTSKNKKQNRSFRDRAKSTKKLPVKEKQRSPVSKNGTDRPKDRAHNLHFFDRSTQFKRKPPLKAFLITVGAEDIPDPEDVDAQGGPTLDFPMLDSEFEAMLNELINESPLDLTEDIPGMCTGLDPDTTEENCELLAPGLLLPTAPEDRHLRDWHQPFSPEDITAIKGPKDGIKAIFHKLVERSCECPEIEIIGTSMKNGSSKHLPIIELPGLNGDEWTRTIIVDNPPVGPTKISTLSDILRGKTEPLGFRFRTKYSLNRFYLKMREKRFLDPRDEKALWCHCGRLIMKLTSDEEFFKDWGSHTEEEYWNLRAAAFEGMVTQQEVGTYFAPLLIGTSREAITIRARRARMTAEAAQRRIKERQETGLKPPYFTRQTQGRNTGFFQHTPCFVTTTQGKSKREKTSKTKQTPGLKKPPSKQKKQEEPKAYWATKT